MVSSEEGLGRSHKADFEEKQSFVDVVTRNQKCSAGDVADVGEKVIDMSWNSNNNEEEWLSRCAMGILREFTDVSSVNRRLRSRGFSFSSKYLWDKFILWVFESKFERESFIYNRFFWDDKLSSMVKWSDSINPQNRLAWIDCFGVPLRFWNADFFIKIGWLLGEPLLVEEDTFFKKRFDRGRVLVLIPLNQFCPNKIKVTVEHGVEAKGGPEVGGQLKGNDKGDRDQFSLDSGNDSKMVDRLAVNHNVFKSKEEKLAVMALDIGIADRGKNCGVRDIKEKAMYPRLPSSSNDKVDFEIRKGLDCGVAGAEGASLSFSESSLELGLFSNFQLLRGEASNTVDVLMGHEEIVKVGLVESPHEDVYEAQMSSDGPTSENSKA
ncbi:hypothetical protein Dsin_006884 [Dipteronia sinensis]|uniref:DUF4283 domain-containing protein n=1 Tax=Dipteronia sinensis TaxID=43782 RepID=A0AAE0B0G0_9ROSI|nr:hypothetical protein Dsin_006884 [Dipteronia sinensis]